MRKPFVALTVAMAMHLFSVCAVADSREVGFTQEDRDRITRIEVTLQTYMQQNDKRLAEMQASGDKRFEQIDKRLEFMQNLMIGMLVVFGSLCGVFVGLLLWDRKTFKERAKEKALQELERKWRISDWLEALKAYARTQPNLAEILKGAHLL